MSTHPYLRHTDKEIDLSIYIEKHLRSLDLHPEEFVFIKIDNEDYTGPVCYNDSVVLKTWRDYFVSYNSKSELIVSDEVQEGRLKKFTVILPESLISDQFTARYLRVNQNLMLKTTFDEYTIVNERYELMANGPNYCDQTIFQISYTNIPPKPIEYDNREFLDHNYLKMWGSNEFKTYQDKIDQYRSKIKPLNDYSELDMEYVLMNDLMYALNGTDSNYIVRGKDIAYQDQFPIFTWTIHIEEKLIQQGSLSCLNLVKGFCGMLGQYDSIQYFLKEHREYYYGQISQRLCFDMMQVLKEYEQAISQLNYMFKNGELTLNRLSYYLQAPAESLSCLFNMCQRLYKRKGGMIINVIYNLLRSNSTEVNQKICSFLYHKVSRVYFDMLHKWLYMGVIEDPFDDFLVYEDRRYSKESLQLDYNSKYYSSRFQPNVNNSLLTFQEFEKKIVNTGKYINIMKECYRDKLDYEIHYPTKVELNFENARMVVESAHQWACTSLLDYLKTDKSLFELLYSLNSFFLLGNSDYLSIFIAQAELDIENINKSLDIKRLNNLLQICISSSTLSQDPYKEDYMLEISERSLLSELTLIKNFASKHLDPGSGKDDLNNINNTSGKHIDINSNSDMYLGDRIALDLNVPFPMSILINFETRKKYKCIFKLLLMCKLCEHKVRYAWSALMSMKNIPNPNLRVSHFVVNKMHNFVSNLIYHLTADVIIPHYTLFKKEFERASSLDDIIAAQKKMLDGLMNDTLCASPELLKDLIKALNSVNEFSIMLNKFIDMMTLETVNLDIDVDPKQAKQHKKLKMLEHSKQLFGDDFMKNLQIYDSHFVKYLKLFFNNAFLSPDKERILTGLYYRIDFNGYYSERLFDNRINEF